MMVGDRQKNQARTPDHAHLAAGADAMLDGRFDAGNHLYPLRVQYEDTDAGGIVYHAHIWPLPNAPDQHGFDVLALTSQRCLPMTD